MCPVHLYSSHPGCLYTSGAAEPDCDLLSPDDDRHLSLATGELEHPIHVGRVGLDIVIFYLNPVPGKGLTSPCGIRSTCLSKNDDLFHFPALQNFYVILSHGGDFFNRWKRRLSGRLDFDAVMEFIQIGDGALGECVTLRAPADLMNRGTL